MEDRLSLFSRGQLIYLMQVAREQLEILFGRRQVESGFDPGGWDAAYINITFRRGGHLCASMGSGKASAPDSVREAVRRAALDERFGRVIMAGDLDVVVIELWIQTEEHLLAADQLALSQDLRLGLDGLRIELGGAHAYYKPDVAISKGITSPQRLLARLCRKAGLSETAWEAPEANLSRTRWLHLLEQPSRGGEFISMEYLRCVEQPVVDRARIRSAALASAARLLATQRADGAFGYVYEPFTDAWAALTNQVRLAGATYAAARAADQLSDLPHAAQSGARVALRYLLDHVASPSPGGGTYVRELDDGKVWGKLGATALTHLAAQHSAGSAWDEERADLLQFMTNQQEPDGSFRCRAGDALARPSDQDFYPGETLLALAHHVYTTGDIQAAEVIWRAFPYYSDYFRISRPKAFVPWQAEAWSRIACWLEEGTFPRPQAGSPTVQEIAQFVFDQVDWILLFQHAESYNSPPEYVGGFLAPTAPTFSSATFVEAVIHACNLALTVGDVPRVVRYRSAALLGLGFMLHLQVPPEAAPFFQRPALAIGATTRSLEVFKMRCDYDQHFLTATLSALASQALWTPSL